MIRFCLILSVFFSCSNEPTNMLSESNSKKDQDSWVDVNAFIGDKHFSKDFLKSHKRSVGIIVWPGENSKLGNCTGTLISNTDIMITAGHCVGEYKNGKYEIEGAKVGFEYESGTIDSVFHQSIYKVEQVLEYAYEKKEVFPNAYIIEEQLDYALLKISNRPSDKYGFSKISTRVTTKGEFLSLIQHPQGLSKKFSYAQQINNVTGYGIQKFSEMRSAAGASGSGLLDKTGRVVGIYVSQSVGYGTTNSVSINRIYIESSKLRELYPNQKTEILPPPGEHYGQCKDIVYRGLEDRSEILARCPNKEGQMVSTSLDLTSDQCREYMWIQVNQEGILECFGNYN